MRADNDNGRPTVGMALRPEDAPDGWQMVYVATHKDFIKIGTSKDPYRRMRELTGQYILPVRLFASFYGAEPLEGALHRHFTDQALGSEWFDVAGPVKAWFDAGCPDDLPRSLAIRRAA